MRQHYLKSSFVFRRKTSRDLRIFPFTPNFHNKSYDLLGVQTSHLAKSKHKKNPPFEVDFLVGAESVLCALLELH